MHHSTSSLFDTEVLAFWHHQAQWQSAAFEAYAAYLG